MYDSVSVLDFLFVLFCSKLSRFIINTALCVMSLFTRVGSGVIKHAKYVAVMVARRCVLRGKITASYARSNTHAAHVYGKQILDGIKGSGPVQ